MFPSKPLSRFAAHVEPGHRGLLLRYLISYVKPVVKLFLFYSGGLRFELHVRAFKFSEKNYFSLRGMINSLRPTPSKFTKKKIIKNGETYSKNFCYKHWVQAQFKDINTVVQAYHLTSQSL